MKTIRKRPVTPDFTTLLQQSKFIRINLMKVTKIAYASHKNTPKHDFLTRLSLMCSFVAMTFRTKAIFALFLLFTLNPLHASSLAEIETYLNNLNVVKAEFTQFSPGGDQSKGTLYLKRPGLLRMSSQSHNLLIIADGTFLFFIDLASDDITYTPISESPAAILLEKTTHLEQNYDILNYTDGDELIELKLRAKAFPDAGQIILIFRKNPLRLVSWTIQDAGGGETVIKLNKVTHAKTIDLKAFDPTPYLKKKP